MVARYRHTSQHLRLVVYMVGTATGWLLAGVRQNMANVSSEHEHDIPGVCMIIALYRSHWSTKRTGLHSDEGQVESTASGVGACYPWNLGVITAPLNTYEMAV